VTRVASVDLGTNSTRLLVADVHDGLLEPLDRLMTITRLGEGVDEARRLRPGAVERVLDCLRDYRSAIDALGAGRTLAVATSAVRDAVNGRELLDRIQRELGFETRLLSGEEEALLTFRGITIGRTLIDDTVIVDIGGGSTELLLGGAGGVQFHVSLDMGCVRLTERYLASDPPTPAELDACAQTVRILLAGGVPEEVRAAPEAAIGVAGTITTLATLDLGLPEYDPDLIHGHVIAAAAVQAQLELLASLPLARRLEVRGLEPARAPVIVAGALIAHEVLSFFELDGLEASERDILDGAALEAAKLAT
jgi:exopolyphosphatase/guanosine-5'-triphosphate,3'-diphosphate pyrophosphatase